MDSNKFYDMTLKVHLNAEKLEELKQDFNIESDEEFEHFLCMCSFNTLVDYSDTSDENVETNINK